MVLSLVLTGRNLSGGVSEPESILYYSIIKRKRSIVCLYCCLHHIISGFLQACYLLPRSLITDVW